jgi:hypothetical protein
MTVFGLELLGKPDAAGNAAVVDKRNHSGSSVQDAARTAKDIVLNAPVPGTFGFRLTKDGEVVYRWFNGQDDAQRS